jgi:hypothetical protein
MKLLIVLDSLSIKSRIHKDASGSCNPVPMQLI